MSDIFNIDESPLNRDWTKSKWILSPYRSKPFFKELEERHQSITEFKQSAMYIRAVRDGWIVNDKWVTKRKRKKV